MPRGGLQRQGSCCVEGAKTDAKQKPRFSDFKSRRLKSNAVNEAEIIGISVVDQRVPVDGVIVFRSIVDDFSRVATLTTTRRAFTGVLGLYYCRWVEHCAASEVRVSYLRGRWYLLLSGGCLVEWLANGRTILTCPC
ncbi:hypothetical protein GUJ93_ZPchr0007g5796 [Zizania palustris]|uniref:Uncharacterized protein n=1 Tax=Zizania palustris TaxID=103762 RepID=A0A8J5TFA8_ZIZPA|nr:hypothetical protein GUJ93_ZPchr0007g5796 [Zizania palustris]